VGCHIFQKRGCSHGGIKLIISLFLCQWGQFNKKNFQWKLDLNPQYWDHESIVLPLYYHKWSLKYTLRCFLPLVPLAARLKLSNLGLTINCSTTVLPLLAKKIYFIGIFLLLVPSVARFKPQILGS
jgi:hypothetical protein